jgi:hypothetical protein
MFTFPPDAAGIDPHDPSAHGRLKQRSCRDTALAQRVRRPHRRDPGRPAGAEPPYRHIAVTADAGRGLRPGFRTRVIGAARGSHAAIYRPTDIAHSAEAISRSDGSGRASRRSFIRPFQATWHRARFNCP